ncbi:MAG: ABC transporter permease, partial [Bacillota bacterium]|nr:ABC transporter permease [Bacillota bacterium]
GGDAASDRWVRVVMPGVSADAEGVGRFLFYFGFLAMFVLTTALMNAAAILEERENRTLARLLVQGVPYGQVIAGHALAVALTAALQTLILLAVAYPLGGWPPASVPATLAVSLALALAAAGLGVGAAGIAGTGLRLRATGGVVGALLAMLGGAWWPVEVEPAVMQSLGRLSPVFWALDGVHRAVALGAGLAQLLLPLLALLLFAALGGMLGVWGTRRWFA